MIVSFY